MIRRLLFSLIALTSACTLFTDLDGFTSPNADAGDANVVPDVIEAGVEAAVCPPGQDFSNDPKNCGACGHDCLGGSCLANTCQAVMLATEIKTSHIRLDGTFAYFADQQHGAIKRMPKRGGLIETLTEGEPFLYELTLSDDYVYYQAQPGIRRVKKSGGTPEDIVGVGGIGYIEIHDGFLYYGSGAGNAGSATISKANLDGSNVQVLVKDRTGIETFAFDGDQLYYGENGQVAGSGSVRVLTLSSGQDNIVGSQKCRRLAIDKNNVYFLDYTSPALWSVPRTGGVPVPLANSPSVTSEADLALDDTSVFWSVNGNPGGVLRVAKTGGATETISAIPEAAGIALDGNVLYWSSPSANQIYFRVR